MQEPVTKWTCDKPACGTVVYTGVMDELPAGWSIQAIQMSAGYIGQKRTVLEHYCEKH